MKTEEMSVVKENEQVLGEMCTIMETPISSTFSNGVIRIEGAACNDRSVFINANLLRGKR